MFINNGSPTVTNCIFDANIASGIDGGGGILNNGAGNLTLTDCMFRNNVASVTHGGGMTNVNAGVATVTGCTFLQNVAGGSGGGGGMYNNNSSPNVAACSFTENEAAGGGGMFSWVNSSPTVAGCTFTLNVAINGGGWFNDMGSPTATSCAFVGNTAIEGGGMFINQSDTTVTNCMFSGNSAAGTGGITGNGGGIRNSASNPTITHCTFSDNVAREGGGMRSDFSSQPLIKSCIFWDNFASETGNEIANAPGSITTVSFSDIRGSLLGGNWNVTLGIDGGGNIDDDPLFVDADGTDNVSGTLDDDLRVLLGSPSVDMGDNDSIPPDFADLDGDGDTLEPTPFDLDGRQRAVCDVDMGAYEFRTILPPQSSTPPSCVVDARQPHDPLNPESRFGWTEFTFEFECIIAPPLPGFTVSVGEGTPPAIIEAIESENTLTLVLDEPIPAGQWTCFTHDDSGEQTCFGYLPADVNGDGVSAPSDILAVIDSLNGVVPLPEYATDADRSDESGPADILRVIDLLNGAAAFEPWLDVVLSDCPSGN